MPNFISIAKPAFAKPELTIYNLQLETKYFLTFFYAFQ